METDESGLTPVVFFTELIDQCKQGEPVGPFELETELALAVRHPGFMVAGLRKVVPEELPKIVGARVLRCGATRIALGKDNEGDVLLICRTQLFKRRRAETTLTLLRKCTDVPVALWKKQLRNILSRVGRSERAWDHANRSSRKRRRERQTRERAYGVREGRRRRSRRGPPDCCEL